MLIASLMCEFAKGIEADDPVILQVIQSSSIGSSWNTVGVAHTGLVDQVTIGNLHDPAAISHVFG